MRPTLVFDLGGVVLRWAPAGLLRERLPQRVPDLLAAERLAALFFESFKPGSDWVEFDRGRLTEEEVARRIAARLELPLIEVHGVLAGIPEHLALKADTVALLSDLKAAAHRIVYLSNMPAPYCLFARRAIDSLGCFETGLFSSEVQWLKPEPEIFHEAVRRFGVPPEDCLFFDDSPLNVDAARAAGWQALQFTDAAAARRDLQRLGHLPEAGAHEQPVSV